MKYFFPLFLIYGCNSYSCFKCGKPTEPKEKSQKKEGQLAALKAYNQEQPTSFSIGAQYINAAYWPADDHYPFNWPQIKRIVDRSEENTKKWELVIDSNAQCVSIEGPRITYLPTSKDPLEYSWIVRPLAKGFATLKAQYISKEDKTVEDEQIITITVTD